jgi:putative RNA 2'-phosphotransferase
LSRFLALVLRHRAYQFGLEVDDEGYVSLDHLMEVIGEQRNLESTTEEDVRLLAQAQGRARFEIRDRRIRATYGHSFRRLIQYPVVHPPEHLYVGLPRTQLAEIRATGLRPVGRQFVHLSENRDEALEIAQNQDADGTVVTVLAQKAAAQGIPFHHPAEGLFLSPALSADYLDIEISYGRTGRKGKRRR